MSRRPHVFLDCDGVLADFDTLALQVCDGVLPRDFEDKKGEAELWARIHGHGAFFASLPLMPDAYELYEGVKHLQPSILTGCPAAYPGVREQKARWTARHFPDCPVTMCRSKDKSLFCKPGDVLIDDWLRYRDNWRDAGGIFIHHTSAKSSLLELRLHYPALFELEPA